MLHIRSDPWNHTSWEDSFITKCDIFIFAHFYLERFMVKIFMGNFLLKLLPLGMFLK